jgi:uncharacterized protein YjbI with pentapeptide repeats
MIGMQENTHKGESMANAEQLALLKAGLEGWNYWRWEDRDHTPIDLTGADLSGTNLSLANLFGANLSAANLSGANLSIADLTVANLSAANLKSANLREARLANARLIEANLVGADLRAADLSGAHLSAANLTRADLGGTYLEGADLREANLSGTDLREAHLSRADLKEADLREANLNGAVLDGAILKAADLRKTDLKKADLRKVDFREANLSVANLSGANLSEANLGDADLRGAHLREADLREANLSRADLRGADLRGADLNGAVLVNSNLIQTNINNAKISKSEVYGVNVWDLKGEFKEQRDLIITAKKSQSSITVDNIKVAQFIYLILNNKEIRDVINTLTSKTVLILGRFALPERKTILDALRDKLREYDLLPIVFDFDRPADKDFTETIKTLAGISYFVIADVTNPKSSPLELQATIPDYQIPFVPIIQEGEYPFAMMVDLQKKYNWVLDTISYDSLDTLIEILKPHIIDPAIKKRDELRLVKAKEPTIISGRELREKKA